MRRGAVVLPALLPALLTGCAENSSALNPAGPAAHAIADLTWLFVGVCGAIYLLVLATAGWAMRRAARRATDTAPRAVIPPGADRGRLRWIGVAIFATVAVLSGFVAASYATDRRLIALETAPGVEIKVIGHQWWWEIRYMDPVPSRGFTTANEMHLPRGEPARITLSSADVIHSFWVPNITGKRDIFPGKEQSISIRADAAGEWIGRCAEFCGLQHAHMDLAVVVEDRAAFDAWRAAQAASAIPPESEEEKRGEQVFSENNCVICHVVRGSPATGISTTAPDLTHLKSRRMLAAGTVPNSKGFLGGWVADPQALKPGVQMPPNPLPPEQFQALLAYLETLQ